MRPGKKKLSKEFQLPNGGVGEAALRREIQAQNIGGTIRVGLADIADGACKSERQMRAILTGTTSIKSGYNVAAIDGLTAEIDYGKPVVGWPDSYVPWTVQSSLDAGGRVYFEEVRKLRSLARQTVQL